MRIVICDDEKKTCTHLRGLVEKQSTDSKITEVSSGDALLIHLQSEIPDIIFLDIGMDGKNGMEAARTFREHQALAGQSAWRSLPLIVFVTGYPDYMPQAFDVAAFGFLVKPVEEQKFNELFRRAESEIRGINAISERAQRIISLDRYGCNARVKISDILYVESAGHKTVIHLRNGKDLSFYGKISDLETELGEDFFRIHRSFLVNLEVMEGYDRKEVHMEKGVKIPISRYKYQEFARAALRQVTGL